MRLVFVVIGALLLAVLATLFALENPGYVIIMRPPWRIEMAFTLYLLLTVLSAAFVGLIGYLLVRLVRIPRDVARWRTQRAERQAHDELYHGLIKLAEANWTEAETNLLASMRGGDMPLLSYLGAACVNQGQGELEKRDEYLANAHRNAPQYSLAIGMTQANLQYLAHQSEQALATLSELRRIAPKHKHVLRLLAQLYLELRDWTNLANLAPHLRESNVLGDKEIDLLELRAHRELLVLNLPTGAKDVLEKAWNSVPKPLQRHPTLVAIYARQLIAQNEMNRAEIFLRAAIEQHWDEALVELYGLAHSNNAAEQLETAEGWLGFHSDNPRLLLTLGRLAVYAQRDSLARSYFEKSIHLRGPAEAHVELGRLLERLGDKDAALACYRRGTQAYAEGIKEPMVRGPLSNLTPRQSVLH